MTKYDPKMGRLESQTLIHSSMGVQSNQGGGAHHANDPTQDDQRIIFLAGEIDEHTTTATIAQMFLLSKMSAVKPIHLIINSPGGSIYDMFALYDAIKFVPAPVETIGMGKIMSAGVLLLAAGTKSCRKISKHATVMMHQAWYNSEGNVFSQRVELKETERLQSVAEQCIADESRQSIEVIHAIMEKGQDHYMSADDAIKLGLADCLL